jgi:hypothetical protein
MVFTEWDCGIILHYSTRKRLESFEKLLFQITLNTSNYSCVSIPEKTGEIRKDLKNKRSRVHCVLASWADIKKNSFS